MNEKKINEEDQINLGSFIIGLLRFFFRSLAFIAYTIKKYKWFLLASFIAGVIVGWFYAYPQKMYYKGTMIASQNKLSKKTYAAIFDQLNQLIESGTGSELSKQLQLPENLAANLVYVEPIDMNDQPLKYDSSQRMFMPFKIVVTLQQLMNADSLQNAILFYLNNGPYLKKLIEAEKQNNIAKVEFIDNDLKKLDTLKTEFNKFLASAKPTAALYNNMFDPANVYAVANSLLHQREMASRYLAADAEAISIVDGFKFAESPSISISLSIFTAGVLGFLASLLIGLLIQTKKKIIPR